MKSQLVFCASQSDDGGQILPSSFGPRKDVCMSVTEQGKAKAAALPPWELVAEHLCHISKESIE
jgi:hypothetical protein